ncbi:MAG: hypothetical protein EA404_13410 [Spirochaetaceae bacterium]|nr:MAG: hypothetical protein EA404_13410 [Spirochaetaceae bacterium]
MSDQYHEPAEELSGHTRDCTRILMSLKEEVEAVDWYNQRMSLAGDEGVRRILEHNRNEEMEHACMALEWLRRNMPGWDEMMQTYLFSEGDIVASEEAATGHGAEHAGGSGTRSNGSARGLGIGHVRDREKR